MVVGKHKKKTRIKIKIGILTVSTSRTLDNDKSGAWIKKFSSKEGCEVLIHKVIPDHEGLIKENILSSINDFNLNALLITGGTGISDKDVTIEAVKPLFYKELTAFGSIFTSLSFEEIDSAAVLSRATAGIIGKTIVFCMPGSLNACKLACKNIIFPELGHILNHVNE